MKLNLIIMLAFLCLSCAKSVTPGFKYYEAQGGNNIKQDIFNLNLDQTGDPNIDEYHRINPKNFLITDFKQPEKYYHVKSSRSGKVFECQFEEGDMIIIPVKE